MRLEFQTRFPGEAMRSLVQVSLFVSACAAFGLGQGPAHAGELSPRASAFKNGHLDPEVSAFKARLEKLIGVKVEVAIDVASYDMDYGAGSVLEDAADVMKGFKNNCFDPLLAVTEELSKTPELKSHLAKRLKLIDIKNTGDADATWGTAVLKGSTLAFNANATKNIDGPYADKTRKILSAALRGGPAPAAAEASAPAGGNDGRSDAVIKCQQGCNRQCGGASNKAKCVGQCRRACEG
jgi:hypothetical protein